MKKLLSLVALAGMLVVAGSANAQYVFHVGPSLTGTPPQPVEGASGMYHVVINQLSGSTFEVIVSGHEDGNVQDAPVGTNSPPPNPPVPKSGIGRISLNFYTADESFDPGMAVAGSSTAYSGPGPGVGVMNNVGGPRNLEFGAGGGEWFVAEDAIVFTTPFRDRYVAPHGGNEFRGTFTLTDANWGRVGISLQDSGQQWSGEFFRSAIPEASSLALLLPGLVPLALVIRRRRRVA